MSLLESAKAIITNSLKIRKGEVVLILTDTNKESIAKAFQEAAEDAGAHTILMEITPTDYHGEEPPEIITRAMGQADAIIAPTTYSITHTKARAKATDKGARVISLPGITPGIMNSGSISADYAAIARDMYKVSRKLRGGKEIEILTPRGTNLTLSIRGREWIRDSGLAHRKGGFTNLPAGELFIAVNERSTNGTVVIDGSFGEPIEKPVKMRILKGEIKRITNANFLRKKFKTHGKRSMTMGKFGIGMNPQAKPKGELLEAEKALGTVNIGFGNNASFGGKISLGFSIEGVITQPTVLMDGKPVIEAGKLVI